MTPPTGTKPPPLPGWLMIGFNYTYLGTKAANLLWLAYDPTESEAAVNADLVTLEPLIANSWLTRFSPYITNAGVLATIRLVLFRASGELASTFTPAYSGSGGTEDSSASIAACVNWETDAYYRGGKPKTFIPAVDSSKLASVSQLSSAYSEALGTAMSSWSGTDVPTFVSTHLTTPPEHIAPSWQTGNAYRDTAIQRLVYSAWVQPRICTQRRRLGKAVG
jgi:hypothetical protein